MYGFAILALLFVLLLASMPTYPYSRSWGYRPGLVLLALLLVWLVLIYLGSVAFWLPWAPPAEVAPPAY